MTVIGTSVGRVDIGDLAKSVGDGDRFKRHLVAIAARHLARGPGGRARCSREAISGVTAAIRRAFLRTSSVRGVCVKWMGRDPLSDWMYRRARGLAARAPWPRDAAGSAMGSEDVEREIGAFRSEVAEIDRRLAALGVETPEDLADVCETMMRPMPLDRRIALCAPPIAFATPRRRDPDVAAADRQALAVLHSISRRAAAERRALFDRAMVARGVALVEIFRRRRGLG